uniref:Uncharacterized protein n=1 Tax=Meloidogyne hapla TaxID=6305 RepID=A0A1I8BID2_MELHA
MIKIFIFSLFCGQILMLELKDNQKLSGYCKNEEDVKTFKHGKLGELYYKFLLNQTSVTESMEEYRLQEEQKVDWGMSSGNYLIILTLFPFSMIWISVWIILYILITNTDKYLLLENKKDD